MAGSRLSSIPEVRCVTNIGRLVPLGSDRGGRPKGGISMVQKAGKTIEVGKAWLDVNTFVFYLVIAISYCGLAAAHYRDSG